MAILVTGKSTALGQKQPCPSGQWNEMTITKAPKIVQFAVGHDGLHRSVFCVLHFLSFPQIFLSLEKLEKQKNNCDFAKL